jgi:site-specific DNA recombinase
MLGIIFARESNRYDKTVYSLKSQVEACLERARADGVPVTEKYVFREQFSGRDLRKMPKLAEMRKILERTPGPKVIYCYSQDRLVRGEDSFDIFYLLVEFRHFDTELRLILNPIQPRDIASQIFALVKGHEASTEIEKILDRTMRGKLERIKDGKIPGFGRNKYGYTKNGQTGKATINEAEAAVLRRIVRELLAGESISEVVRRLNGEGVPPPFPSKGEKSTKLVKHGKWWTSSLSQLLRDPAYKGEGAALRRVSVNGRVRPRPENGWIKLPSDCYPPIIAPADWDRLQDIFAKNRGAKTRNRKRQALLRGLIFCAVCGRAFYVANNSCRGRTHLYYRCATITDRRTRSDISKCPVRQISALWIEEAVWSEVAEKISDPAKLRAALAEGAEPNGEGQIEEELATLRADLDKKDVQERNLAREMRDATPAVARVLKAELDRIESERGALLARQAELTRRRAAAEHRQQRAVDAERLITGLAKKLSRLAFEQKRVILEELGARVKVNGREFTVSYSIGG